MTNFILNNTEYRFTASSGRYSKTIENGKTTRIGKTEWELAVEEFEAKEKAAQDEFEQFEAEADFADIEAMLAEDNSVSLEEYTETLRNAAIDSLNKAQNERNEFTNIGEAEIAAEMSKKSKGAPKKVRRPKDIGYENKALQVTLTARQTDFIKRLPNSCFYEDGLNSALWVDCLSDDLGGQFANKPMTVGAMVSTLNEKNLISVGKERREGRKVAFFTFTPMGQKVAKELGLK